MWLFSVLFSTSLLESFSPTWSYSTPILWMALKSLQNSSYHITIALWKSPQRHLGVDDRSQIFSSVSPVTQSSSLHGYWTLPMPFFIVSLYSMRNIPIYIQSDQHHSPCQGSLQKRPSESNPFQAIVWSCELNRTPRSYHSRPTFILLFVLVVFS